jgi:N-acetyl-anhydromuramyl-L-alanine amidase AmpD
VDATGAATVSNANGDVTVTLAEGPDQVLHVTPAAGEASTGPATTTHGGAFGTSPRFQLRPFDLIVSVDGTGFMAAPAPRIALTLTPGAPAHALVFSAAPGRIVLDWKPDWIKSTNRAAVSPKQNNVLVLHQTGTSDVIGSSLNTFTNPANVTGIHYLVDVDGHVVKLVNESDRVNHTGPSFWGGNTRVNAESVGIEIVHAAVPVSDFTAAQYTTVLRLVREIRAANATITRQNVVGHGDVTVVSTTNRTISNDRVDDPGQTFDWAQVEGAIHARRRNVGAPPATVYGIGPGQVASSVPGRTTRGLVANITQAKTDLSAIGYSVATNGTTINANFDGAMFAAVRAFQQRYFSGPAAGGGNRALRGAAFTLGDIDFETAVAINQVVGDTGA